MSEKVLPCGLTVRQDKFAQNIAAGQTQGAAAVSAGYAPTGADTQANRLLKNDKVRARIQYFRTQHADRAALDAAYVLAGLMANAEAGAERVPVVDREGDVVDEKPRDLQASNTAYGMLGKHLRLFVDRTSHELGDGVKDVLDKLVEVLDEEVPDAETRGRIITRLLQAAGET